MSHFQQQTKHPTTGEWAPAWWRDDYFGPHRYGVEFPDGLIVDPLQVSLETRAEDCEVEKAYRDLGEPVG